MSTKRFIEYLQELLTMMNKDDPSSVGTAKNALSAVVALAFASKKADPLTLRIMKAAENSFEYLAAHADDFSGVPGSYFENEKKRKRLLQMLSPSC